MIDLAKEIDATSKRFPEVSFAKLSRIAKRFFELGQKDAANKYDEIEYNRQRVEEETLGKTLDEAAEKEAYNYCVKNKIGESIGAAIYDAYETAFRTGAEWQKEKDTRDMYMSDNRHFQKVYELGKKDMKEQMMKELEVDLDKEIDNYFYPKNFKRVNDGVEFPGWHVSDWKNPNVGKTLYTEDIRRFAHHFYELKLNTRKEK